MHAHGHGSNHNNQDKDPSPDGVPWRAVKRGLTAATGFTEHTFHA